MTKPKQTKELARPKDPAAAQPPVIDIWTTELYDGAELRPFEGRPGSMDFKKLPSKGLSV